jgi:aspartyl-tRNA(Asn)/glutamyl-tRNA(Gln) amidotransferase subunit A
MSRIRHMSDAARALREGRTTSRALVEEALAAIADDDRAFTRVYAERARAEADLSDRGPRTGPLAGLPVSVKDLFDVVGEPTLAGAAVLQGSAPAAADGPVVERLRRAGAIVIGKTHMSAFAFTAVGLNPHGPQPPNPIDPERVPGGSSSGAGVAVALGQGLGSIGTDTGGSIRIPAALCGVTGFKPTQRRVTRAGATPLAESLDSVGPLAADVEGCRLLDAAIADAPPERVAAPDLAGLRLAVLRDFVLDDLDARVARDFDHALDRLAARGVAVAEARLPELAGMAAVEARGGVINAEAYATHRRAGWLNHRALYDPNVLARIEIGAGMSAEDLGRVRAYWAGIGRSLDALGETVDALVWPTCPIVAPRIDGLADPSAFGRANLMLARNTRIANLTDRCAISLPMSAPGALGTGFMLVGPAMEDARLLAVAAAVEAALA